MPDRRTGAALAGFAALLPAEAAAHGPGGGMAGFWHGLVHPALTPAHGLALLAIGLALAPAWPDRFGRAWAAFAAATVAGMMAASLGLHATTAGVLVPWAATAIALYAAAAPDRLPILPPVLAAAAGLLLGAVSAPGPGPMAAMAAAAAGAFAGLNLGLLYVAGGAGWLLRRFAHPSVRIGLRVAAAWIAAIACLLAALQLAPGRAYG